MAKKDNKAPSNFWTSIKKVALSAFRLRVIFILFLIIVFFISSLYILKGKEIAFAQDDPKNVPANAAKFTNNVTIDENGNISTAQTPLELWEEMKKNGSNIDKYLDSAEDLSKLMNAQLVTQYMDTRNEKEIDKDIDWDSIYQATDSTNVQGIIKMKRADSAGNETRMTFVDKKTFNSWIDKYNQTGDANAKKNLLSHFTLEESSSSFGGAIMGIGDFCWPLPAENTKITSKFGPRAKPVAGASTNHGGIDISATIGTEVYAAADGTVSYAGWQDPSNHSTGFGNYVRIDHGNGCLTYYGHCSELLVSNGEQVKQGQLIARTGNTGASSGPHLHFEVRQDGTKINPMNFFSTDGTTLELGGKVSSGTETTDESSSETEDSESTSSVSTTNTASNACALVATFQEIGYSEDTDDPEETIAPSTMEYVATSTRVYYQNMTSGYTMPFNYLWTWLVLTENKDFVMDLADLVYNSKIEFTVYEKYNGVTNIETVNYTRQKNLRTYAEASLWYNDVPSGTKSGNVENSEGKQFYHTYKTTTVNQTANVLLTKANVWMLDYELDYNAGQKQEVTSSSGPTAMNDEFVIVNQRLNGEHALDNKNTDLGRKNLEEIKSSILDETNAENITWNTVRHTYNVSKVNQSKTTQNIVSTQDYVTNPPIVTEKTDRDSDEPNFVTVYLASRSARQAVKDLDSWLFEYLEMNDDTKEMVDLTKYLLYMAEGKDYGITEFDFDSFWKKSYESMNGVSAGDIIVNTLNDPSIAIKDVDTLKKAFSGYAGSKKLIENAQIFLDLQEQYNVNAVFAAAVSISETGAGRAGHAIDGKNNWFNISCTCGNSSHGRFETYSSTRDSIEAFYKLIANGKYYFTQGNYSVKTIGVIYCENAEQLWIPNTLKYMTQMLNAAGISVTSTESSSSIVEAAVAVHQEVRNSGYTYNKNSVKKVPNYNTKYIDCSSYVTWVLMKAGVSGFTEGMNQKSSSDFNNNPWGWQEVSINEAQPGDILCYNGHVEIVADSTPKRNKFTVYNCGGNTSIRAKGTDELPESSTSGKTISSITKILRVNK